jgi:hypothetical protein
MPLDQTGDKAGRSGLPALSWNDRELGILTIRQWSGVSLAMPGE